jgi:hypothetical protein
LSKLSFTLALLGQDTCLPRCALGVMFPRTVDRAHFERLTKKRSGRISEKALAAYEAAEDAFLSGLRGGGESVGGKGAEHRVWLNLLPAV